MFVSPKMRSIRPQGRVQNTYPFVKIQKFFGLLTFEF